jgi:hypothetical protein
MERNDNFNGPRGGGRWRCGIFKSCYPDGVGRVGLVKIQKKFCKEFLWLICTDVVVLTCARNIFGMSVTYNVLFFRGRRIIS